MISDVIELDSLVSLFFETKSAIKDDLNIDSLLDSKVLQVESVVYADVWTETNGSKQNETF
jgi:hypothetical protein